MARAAVTTLDAEAAPPEADRLDDFPHPRETVCLYGQTEAERALLSAYRSGRLHHAWLLGGSEGIGKATLAYRFARFLIARAEAVDARHATDLSVPEGSRSFAQVAALAHPNLLVLRRAWNAKTERLGQFVSVEEVRRLRAFLGATPGDGPWRVVIVDSADDLNVSAANALLKSLEEPPPRTAFLLVTAMPGRLPATIRSRCRLLMLRPLGEEDLRQAVADAMRGAGKEAAGGDEIAAAGRLAQGSVRHALQLLDSDGVALHASLMEILRSLPALDASAVHKLADRVTARGQERRFELACTLLEDLLARLVRARAAGTALAGEEAALAAQLVPAHALARWAELWEDIRRARTEAHALNLDRKNLILGLFFRLEAAARAGVSSKTT